MEKINIIEGTPYSPEKLIYNIKQNRKSKNIKCKVINTVYSPYWIFSFHIKMLFFDKYERLVGWYGGLDDLTKSPGVVNKMPSTIETEVYGIQILPDKLALKEAEYITWNYNLYWIRKRYRVLFSSLEKIKSDVNKYYKPIYLMEFHNEDLNQTIYKYLDSLNGDLKELKIN